MTKNIIIETKKNLIYLSKELLDQYESKIDEILVNAFERVLVDSFENFKTIYRTNSFLEFKQKLIDTNWEYLYCQYPVLQKLLKDSSYTHYTNLSYINEKFYQDQIEIESNFLLNQHNKIEDINFGAGDFHNGYSTSIVKLYDGVKIVFKPTDGKVTEAFHKFLEWFNNYFFLGRYSYKIVNRNEYHWLEFIDFHACENKKDLHLYYQRVGFLLCIIYLLNGTDFHCENLIVNQNSPILIDHETIIQPKVNRNLEAFFKSFENEYSDTVIQTLLLPNLARTAANMPLGSCGIGYEKEKEIITVQKKSVNIFSDDWKIITIFNTLSFQKANIPILSGNAKYANDYIKDLLWGFEECYSMLLNDRDWLLSDLKSPLKEFNDVKIRFIWRPTNIYSKILELMKLSQNLKDGKKYEKKIRDYLSLAFKNVSKDSDLRFILEHEIVQMMRGDVPYFEVDSSSKDLKTEFGVIKNFFELSAVENIERKLNKLSIKDLEFQKNVIMKCFE